MFWSIYSAKGGVGTSVIAAALAIAHKGGGSTLLVDFAGDQADLLGVEAPAVGVRDWLVADDSLGTESLTNLIVEISSELSLLPAGGLCDLSKVSPQRSLALVDALRQQDQRTIADLGVVDGTMYSPTSVVCAASTRSTIVLRACYMGLRRAQRLALEADDVVEVVEGGRALRTIDVEAVLGRPVTVRVPVDPVIGRAADQGLLAARIPRPLRRLAGDLERRPRLLAA